MKMSINITLTAQITHCLLYANANANANANASANANATANANANAHFTVVGAS